MKDFEHEVRDILRKNHWLVLSTANKNGVPQSSVVVHASDGNMIYILTGKERLKTRNILEHVVLKDSIIRMIMVCKGRDELK